MQIVPGSHEPVPESHPIAKQPLLQHSTAHILSMSFQYNSSTYIQLLCLKCYLIGFFSFNTLQLNGRPFKLTTPGKILFKEEAAVSALDFPPF